MDWCWFPGSWMTLILDKSAQSLVLIKAVLGKELKRVQEHGSRCRVNSRQTWLHLASFPAGEQETFGGSSRWYSLSALINLAQIKCFSFSFCQSSCSALSLHLFFSATWIQLKDKRSHVLYKFINFDTKPSHRIQNQQMSFKVLSGDGQGF